MDVDMDATSLQQHITDTIKLFNYPQQIAQQIAMF